MAETDLTFLLNARDNASAVINGVRGNNAEAAKDAGEQWKKAGRIIGTALTAVGAAGLKMVSDARKMNATLGQTALTLGISEKEMRNLALATTDVTFPLESVTKTYDILTRAGMRNTKEMQKAAFAFDALGDATGSSADTMASLLIPALKVFGEKIPQNIEDLDKFTWLAKNTTVEMSDFAGVMNYVAAEAGNLDLTSDDLIATLAALEAKGITGSAATRLFRSAVTEAAKEGTDLNEVLGISREELNIFREQMDGAAGVTQDYADVANTQFGIMDKLKQKWSELTLQAGSFLTPLEPMLAGMTALGPVLMFASTGMGMKAIATAKATIALVAHKIATIAVTIASIGLIAVTAGISAAFGAMSAAIMSIPVFGWIAAGITAVIALGILLWKNWDKVVAFFKVAWDSIKTMFLKGVQGVLDNLAKFTDWIPFLGDKIKEVRNAISGMIEAEEVRKGTEALVRASKERIEALRKEKNEIDEKHQAEIDAIKEEWAGYDELIQYKIIKLKEVQDAESKALANRIVEANRAHSNALAREKDYADGMLEIANDTIARQKEIIKKGLEERRDAELADIEKRKIAAKDEYDEVIKAIDHKYGTITDKDRGYTTSLMDQARERARIIKDGYDKEVDAARETYNEKIRFLDAEMTAKLAAYDADISNQVKAIQLQIEAIDKQTTAEDLAMTRANEKQKLLNLQAVIDAAETDEDRAKATEIYAKYATEVNRKELIRQRQDRKESLQDEIAGIRDNAKIGRDALATQLKTEYDQKKNALQKIYDEVTLPDLMKSIKTRKEEVDKALIIELRDIEKQRVDALDIEGKRYTNPEGTGIFDLLDEEEKARKIFFEDQLSETKIHIAAVNNAYEELTQQYGIDIVTRHIDIYEDRATPSPYGPHLSELKPLPGVSSSALEEHQYGGLITFPTWLTRLGESIPYGIMAERRPERIVPASAQTPTMMSPMPTIGTINIYASSRAGGREAGKGFLEELQRRGIRLSGSYA